MNNRDVPICGIAFFYSIGGGIKLADATDNIMHLFSYFFEIN